MLPSLVYSQFSSSFFLGVVFFIELKIINTFENEEINQMQDLNDEQ